MVAKNKSPGQNWPWAIRLSHHDQLVDTSSKDPLHNGAIKIMIDPLATQVLTQLIPDKMAAG